MTAIAVMVCLMIVTLMSGAVLKVSLARRHQVHDRERRLQAEWLVESGVDRALARLSLDRAYTGESWPITERDLGLPEPPRSARSPGESGPAAAVVTISVEPIAGETNRRRIRVQADYSSDPPFRARHSKQMSIDLVPTKAGASS